MLPAWKIIITAFSVLLAGLGLTILEGFVWEGFFNLIEHICYAGNAVLLAIWSWQVFGNRKEDE
jgi:hypothetical protein